MDPHNSYKGIMMNWLDLSLLTFRALWEYRKLSKSSVPSSSSRQLTHNHFSLASWAFPLILKGKLPECDICLRALERKHEISALFISHSQTVTSAIRAPQLGSSRRESSVIIQKRIRRCESVFEGTKLNRIIEMSLFVRLQNGVIPSSMRHFVSFALFFG